MPPLDGLRCLASTLCIASPCCITSPCPLLHCNPLMPCALSPFFVSCYLVLLHCLIASSCHIALLHCLITLTCCINLSHHIVVLPCCILLYCLVTHCISSSPFLHCVLVLSSGLSSLLVSSPTSPMKIWYIFSKVLNWYSIIIKVDNKIKITFVHYVLQEHYCIVFLLSWKTYKTPWSNLMLHALSGFPYVRVAFGERLVFWVCQLSPSVSGHWISVRRLEPPQEAQCSPGRCGG